MLEKVSTFVGGAVVGAVLLGISLFGFSDNTNTPSTEPTPYAGVPAIEECHDGWTDTSTSGDNHVLVLSCSRNIAGQEWLVIRHEDGKFNYAWDSKSPEFIYEENKVPLW